MSQRNRSNQRPSRCGAIAVAACLAIVATGCKSGTSASRSSWWSFGGGADPAKLASAPPFDDSKSAGAVTKPSGLASPYPTTTTPESYTINGSASAAATQVAATSAAAYPSTDNAAPITYGQAAPAPAAYPTTAAAVGGNLSSSAAAAPQAGPYATLPASPASVPASAPSSFESPGGVAFTGLAGEPATTPTARVADSRAGSSFGDSASGSGSRYGDVGAGRSSGSMFSAGPPVASGSGFSGAVSADALEPPLEPARDTALQRYEPPAAPPSAPAATIPPSPPRRRPDPGYRPGGTSSYQPNRAILVGEPITDPAVRTAGFDTPAAPLR